MWSCLQHFRGRLSGYHPSSAKSHTAELHTTCSYCFSLHPHKGLDCNSAPHWPQELWVEAL